MWIVGTDQNVYQWDAGQWVLVPAGGAERIDVDANGTPWVVNSSGEIYTFSNNTWNRVPGLATDIGAGGDIWIIGQDPPGATDFNIYRWNNAAWDLIVGGGAAITVDTNGNPWVARHDGGVYYGNFH